MPHDPTLPRLKCMLVLDSEGKRMAVQYYCPEWSTVPAQAAYEKSVYAKTKQLPSKNDAEITTFSDPVGGEVVVVYKTIGDLTFYVTAASAENELIQYQVLNALTEAVILLLRGAVEKKTVLENLDLLLLAMDETVDGGLVLETDPGHIADRVAMKGAETEMSLTEQTFSRVFASAKEQVARTLLR